MGAGVLCALTCARSRCTWYITPMSIDFALATLTGDLDLTGGRINVTIDRAEIVRQRLESTIALVLGEWFFDQSLGVDYATIIGSKDDERALRLLLDAANSDPDVTDVTLAFTRPGARVFDVTGSARLTTGETVTLAVVVTV